MEILSTCFRILLFGIEYILISIVFMDSVLIRREKTILPWVVQGLLWVVKAILLGYVLRLLYGEQIWYLTLNLSYLVIFSILILVILCYLYTGSVLKIALAQIVCEVNYATVLGGILAVLNYFEGRTEPMGYGLPFQLPDLLTFPVIYAIIRTEVLLLKPLLSSIQSYELKYRKTGWILVSIYFAFGILTSFNGLPKGIIYNGWVMIPIFAVSAVGSAAGFLFLLWYRKKTEPTNIFLYSQADFMENYLQVLKQQIMKMESNQEDSQIDQISRIAEQIGHGKISKANQEKIWRYMRNLKEKYEAIQTGIYCNDWLVDGVLYSMSRFCREHGMKIIFSFQTYDRGKIAEEDIAEIIYQLLTYGAKESLLCKKGEGESEDSQLRMSLQAAAVRNQLILNGSFYSVKSPKKLERELKRKLSIKIMPYDGRIAVFNKEGEEKQISIQMQREKK